MKTQEQLAQQVMLTVSKVLARDLSDEDAFLEMLRSMCEQLRWLTASFWRLEDDGKQLHCEVCFCCVPCDAFRDVTLKKALKKGEGLPGTVWKKNAPVWISDVTAEPNFPRRTQAVEDGLHSAFAFPVSIKGKFIGVFEFFSKEIAEPDTDLVNAFAVVGTEVGQFFERRRAEQQLRRSEQRFRQFAASVDETFFVSSPRLTSHFYVSPAFEKMWGFPVQRVFDRPQAWLEAVLPEHRERVANYVQLLDGETMPEEMEIDYPIERPDGSRAWFSARCFPILAEDGTWQVCGTVRDITDRKAAEERIGEFYSMASHELRTPLSSIKGSLLLLQRQKAGTMPDRALGLIEIARKECERLIRLVNDMLDIKTIEVGKLQLYCQLADPGALVDETIDLMKPLAIQHKINLVISIATEDSISCDKDRIVQVLTNLLSNALKFAPANSDVVVKVEPVGDMIQFSVRDDGPGIAASDLPKLFKVFQQIPSDKPHAQRSTGLGLAISKGIIEEHGGQIGVKSEPGKGSTFWFKLKRA